MWRLISAFVFPALLAMGQTGAAQDKWTVLHKAQADRVEAKGLLADAATQTYLQSLATRLAERAEVEVTAKVVQADDEAFAVIFQPGRLYVSTAWLRKTPSEEALIEGLAHQIAHLRVAPPAAEGNIRLIRTTSAAGLCRRFDQKAQAAEPEVDALAASLVAALRGDAFSGMQQRLNIARPVPTLRR